MINLITEFTLIFLFSDNDSNCSPIHRDTSASPLLRDGRDPKYKVVLSSNASECGGDWEWDSEGLSADFGHPDFAPEHETWLQVSFEFYHISNTKQLIL